MFFPVSGVEIDLLYLVALGFIVGFLGGFFGVGGGTIYVPVLLFLGVPVPIAVGTSLAFIAGKSIVGMFTHAKLDNVDVKLGIIMLLGVIPGTEIGAISIEILENYLPSEITEDLIIMLYILLLGTIASVMLLESLVSIRKEKHRHNNTAKDTIAFQWLINKVRKIKIEPRITLKTQEESISIWVIIAIGFFTGLLSGLLGVGGGFVRVPLFVYVLGVPTTLAIGTDLLEIVFSAGFGTISHSVKGNVDYLIALITSLWGCIGAYVGAILTQFVSGQKIRLLFVSIPLVSIFLLLF